MKTKSKWSQQLATAAATSAADFTEGDLNWKDFEIGTGSSPSVLSEGTKPSANKAYEGGTALKVSLPHLAEALRAERAAVMNEMERRHMALLLELGLQSSPDSHVAHAPQEVVSTPRTPDGIADGVEIELQKGNAGITSIGVTTASSEVWTPNGSCALVDRSSEPIKTVRSSRESYDNEQSNRFRHSYFASHGTLDLDDRCDLPIVHSSSQHISEEQLAKRGNWFQVAVLSPFTEVLFCILILSNVVVIAAKMQYTGIENGFILDFPGSQSNAEATWPNFMVVNNVLEIGFGIIFTIEVSLKLAALQCRFFVSGWNCFDFAIVGAWMISQFVDLAAVLNPTMLRLARLGKLMRLIRLVKWLKMLDSLHVLIISTFASLSVLVWSSVLLVTLMTSVTLVFGTFVSSHIEDESRSLEDRRQLYQYFGSFTRSFFSVFEVTLGNWVPVCRLLLESINEWYAFVLIFYKLIVEFSVIKVITGVFMHETFKVAQTDDHIMVLQKNRAVKANAAKMLKLFDKADEGSEGGLSWEQFEKVVSDPFIRSWLSAMELSMHDLPALFKLMDDGDGKLTSEELIRGVDRLKGAARGVDMATALFDIKTALDEINNLKIALFPQGNESA